MNYLSYGIGRHDGCVLYGNGYMVGKEEEEEKSSRRAEGEEGRSRAKVGKELAAWEYMYS